MLPVPSHCTVVLAAAVVMVGGVLSIIVSVAVVGVVFPQASVATNVTVVLPEAPHPVFTTVKLFVQVTPEHRSVATAPPLLFNQACKAVLLPFPSH